jgi:hypothetical protein
VFAWLAGVARWHAAGSRHLWLITGLCAAVPGHADEGGVSFWLPGQFGSFAAVQSDPGWSLGSVFYHTSVDADGSREFPVGANIVIGLESEANLIFLAPSYAFAGEIWGGGQLSLGVTAILGEVDVDVDATLTGPEGEAISRSVSDSESGFGDLYPTATVRWNDGNHNYMTYLMGGVPVGEYDEDKLANLGTNHWSADLGAGYTYLNQENGREFSAVLGFTYNFENPDTDYQNGVDAHLDWAVSQFLSETFHLGLVGYFYEQLSGDSGDGAVLGDFESSVIGLGPQLGWFLGDGSVYLNVKGYYEFDAGSRPEGWNAWLTLSMPL